MVLGPIMGGATMKSDKKRKIRLQLRVTPDKIDYRAISWYTDSTKLIKELYGKNWQLFCNILAATSPRQSVKKNWKLSDSLLKAYLDRDAKPEAWAKIISDLMPAHLINVIRALQGRPIKGPKVSRFAENLKGNLDVVTIDVWICKAYGIEHKRLTSRVYEQLESKIIKEAIAANVKPANYQALIWYCIRRLNYKNPRSFVSVYRSIFMETPYFAFMADEK